MKTETETVTNLIPQLYLSERRHIIDVIRENKKIDPSELFGRLFLHLVESQRIGIEDRLQFRAISAQLLRRILIRLARKQGRTDKGKLPKELLISSAVLPAILRLEREVTKLGKNDMLLEQVFVMRFYGRITFGDIGKVLDIHPSIAESKWNYVSEKLWPRSGK